MEQVELEGFAQTAIGPHPRLTTEGLVVPAAQRWKTLNYYKKRMKRWQLFLRIDFSKGVTL
jgi:hypothetical protein